MVDVVSCIKGFYSIGVFHYCISRHLDAVLCVTIGVSLVCMVRWLCLGGQTDEISRVNKRIIWLTAPLINLTGDWAVGRQPKRWGQWDRRSPVWISCENSFLHQSQLLHLWVLRKVFYKSHVLLLLLLTILTDFREDMDVLKLTRCDMAWRVWFGVRIENK